MLPSLKKPLGYIELPTGTKPIYMLNDIFLNYIFMKAHNWEKLRIIANIIIEDCKTRNPQETQHLQLILGKINVTTQYEYLLDPKNIIRTQDIRIDHITQDKTTFLEFQNQAFPIKPIKVRALEYFGLSIGHSKGKIADQLWLLSENVPDLLHNEIFTTYTLVDNITNNPYPQSSSITFVSLTKLSQENTTAANLAKMLLGREYDTTNEIISSLSQDIEQEFSTFKEDKEIKTMMTVEERFRENAMAEGVELGMMQGRLETAKKLLHLGLPLEQISEATDFSIEQLRKELFLDK